MRKLLVLILLLSIVLDSNGQSPSKKEDDKFKFYGTLDFRNSYKDDGFFGMYGIKIGVGNKKLRFGGCYHIYHKNLLSIRSSDNFFGPVTVGHFQTKHHVASVFTEIIVHQTPRWELILPIHLGIGKMSLDADKAETNHLHVRGHDFEFRQRTEWVESAVVSMKANYRIVKWVGLTTGFGYNYSFSDSKIIRSNFSYLFYSFGVKLFFNEIGKLARDKQYREKYMWNPKFTKQENE